MVKAAKRLVFFKTSFRGGATKGASMELNGPITSGSHESKYYYVEVKGALEGSYLDSKGCE